jgi:hypothetical protein
MTPSTYQGLRTLTLMTKTHIKNVQLLKSSISIGSSQMEMWMMAAIQCREKEIRELARGARATPEVLLVDAEDAKAKQEIQKLAHLRKWTRSDINAMRSISKCKA